MLNAEKNRAATPHPRIRKLAAGLPPRTKGGRAAEFQIETPARSMSVAAVWSHDVEMSSTFCDMPNVKKFCGDISKSAMSLKKGQG